MEFVAINGDEPRFHECRILCGLANAMSYGKGLVEPVVLPVKSKDSRDLLIQVVWGTKEEIWSYDELFDWYLPESSFPNRRSAEMWIADQARLERKRQ